MYRLSVIALIVSLASSPSGAVGSILNDLVISSEMSSFSQANSTSGNSSSSAKCSTFHTTMIAFNKALKSCKSTGSLCSTECHAFYTAQMNFPMSDCVSNYRDPAGMQLTTAYITNQNAYGRNNANFCKVCSSFSKIFEEGIKLDKKCRSTQIKIVNGKTISGGTTCKDDCIKMFTYIINMAPPSNKKCLQMYTLDGRQATESSFAAFKQKNKKSLDKCTSHSFRSTVFIGIIQSLIFTAVLLCRFQIL